MGETGELSYQLTDMLDGTDGRKIYYRYQEKDDFGRLYKDFLVAGTPHDFYSIELSYAADPEEALKEYENYISGCM